MASHKWKTIASKVVYTNPYFRIREDTIVRPSGRKDVFFAIDQTPSLMIVAVTADMKVCLINQYRYANGRFSWEIPGGAYESRGIAYELS